MNKYRCTECGEEFTRFTYADTHSLITGHSVEAIFKPIMKTYECNDCEDGEYIGTCRLSIPKMAAKPKTCPIFNDEECTWREVTHSIANGESG